MTSTIDAFTLRHLSEYVDVCIFAYDREPFLTWVLDQLADDPGLANLGWPSLYRSWMYINDQTPRLATNNGPEPV